MGAVLKIDILADGNKAASVLDNVGRKVGGFAKGLAAGAAGGAVAVGALAVSAIKSASEVEQAFGGSEAIFGKHADAVIASAKGAATTVGLAQGEYANLANILGAQLKNMGTGADELAPKTSNLIGLGADLAATFGGTTADAVSAVSSLLKGEADPIERYGVSIKASDISARMAADGLGKLEGAALKQATAQTALKLLTEQTTSAQGAFGRESDTAAGQQQRLAAQWENAKATLGKGLLPIVTKFATFLVEKVLPVVEKWAKHTADKLGPGLSTLGKWIQEKLVPALKAIGQWITEKVVPAAQKFYAWFVEKIVPGIKSSVLPILEGAKAAFDKIKAAVERNAPQLEKIGRLLKTVAEFAAKYVLPVFGKQLGDAFKGAGIAISAVIDTIGWLTDKIESAIGWVRDLIGWLGRIHMPSFGGGFDFDFGGIFGLAAPQPAVSAPAGFAALSGGAVALAEPTLSPLAARTAPAVAQTVHVDARTYVQVDGALDPVGVARQIRSILLDDAERSGRKLVAL